MARFRYTAIDAAGAMTAGTADADSSGQLVDRLQRQGLMPVTAEAARDGGAASPAGWRQRRRGALAGADLVLFARQLSRLLAAGLPLDRALELVGGLLRGRAGQEVVAATLDRVRGGATLADAMAAQGAAFPRVVLAMVRAGERGGALASVLERLADFLARVEAVRQAVASALIYPAILAVAATGSVGLVLTVVLPQFTPLFAESGARIPALTLAVMAAGELVGATWWAVPPVLLALLLLWRRAMRNPGFARAASLAALRLPVLGGLIARYDAARFARTLGALLANGVPAPDAMPLAADAVGNRALAEALGEATARLREGEGLAVPLQRSRRFPDLLIRLAGVGEQTGRLAELLGEAADLLDGEAQRLTDRLLALLVPGLTILMGLAIAVIVAAVLMAMISINDLAA
jgi:general secretion pathway protein F